MPAKEPDRLVFAARLKTARETAGWTQDGAAIALGMNRVAYGDYERGKRGITALRLMEFVRVLGLDPKAIVPEWFQGKPKP